MSKLYPCVYCTEDLHCTKYSDDDSESWCVLGPCSAETPSNADLIRSADTEIGMVDIILKLVKKIPEGEDKRRTLYQLLMQEAKNG